MTEQRAAQFAIMGAEVPVEIISDGDDEEPTEVFAENAGIVDAFLALQTQWRQTAIAGIDRARAIYTGIDYAAADVVLRRHGLGDDRRPLDDLAIMETAALRLLNGDR